MASQAIWYYTDLPKEIIEGLEKDLEKTFDKETFGEFRFVPMLKDKS